MQFLDFALKTRKDNESKWTDTRRVRVKEKYTHPYLAIGLINKKRTTINGKI